MNSGVFDVDKAQRLVKGKNPEIFEGSASDDEEEEEEEDKSLEYLGSFDNCFSVYWSILLSLGFDDLYQVLLTQ